jgi:hypothetical protein
MTCWTLQQRRLCTVPSFQLNFALEDAIGSHAHAIGSHAHAIGSHAHACSLEASQRVTNGIPLGGPLYYIVTLQIRSHTLKAWWPVSVLVASDPFPPNHEPLSHTEGLVAG